MTKMVSIDLIDPHPQNPRLAPRQEVIDQITAQLKATGRFDEAHALIVRPKGDRYETVSGHHRLLAAKQAALTEVPVWEREMSDEDAYMALVLNNAQSELSPLEEGLHAVGSRMSPAAYGELVGRPRTTILMRHSAAKVAEYVINTVSTDAYASVETARLSEYWRCLTEIHAAPKWLWSALVRAAIIGSWTVEKTRKAVSGVSKLDAPPEWADAATIANGVVERVIGPDVVGDFSRIIEEARIELTDAKEDADRLIAAMMEELTRQKPWQLSEVMQIGQKFLDEQRALLAGRRQTDLLRTKREEEVAARIARLRNSVSLEEWKTLADDEKAALLTEPPADAGSFNTQKSDDIEWAQFSWNPVTGCLHDCPYCYARDISNQVRMRDYYPNGFAPTLRPAALFTPRHMQVPPEAQTDARFRNVFTCSMADLFGRWVPREWIEAVLREIRAAPQWTFLCLTKFPKRMAEFDIPENVWMGTTVDLQARVKNAERAFEKVKAGVRWLSVEPMLEPIQISRFDLFDWIVIGGASKSDYPTPAWRPPFDWIADLTSKAQAAGVPVYHKTNLLGSRVLEMPNGLPVKGDPQRAPDVFHYLGKFSEIETDRTVEVIA